jgi:hypothetical protein
MTTYSGASLSGATSVTFQAPIVFSSSSGGVILATDTIVRNNSGTIFDGSTLRALSVTVTGGLLSNQSSNGALEFGLTSGSGLQFSKPIKVEIRLSGYSGSTIPVLVKHGGTTAYVTSGLTNNPASTCTAGIPSSPSAIATVTGSVATIYSCAASTFVAYTETAIAAGGGGGGSYVSTPLTPVQTALTSTGSTPLVAVSLPIDTQSVTSSG